MKPTQADPEVLEALHDFPKERDLYLGLTDLFKQLQRHAFLKWRRFLPLGDYLSHRWRKAENLGFGEGTSIYDSSLVIGDVRVGKHSWIGPFTVLDGSGTLEIGDYCSISAGAQIYSHDSVDWTLSAGKSDKQRAPTRIGSRCYIGPNAIVAMGVSIGEGSVIGANSVVMADIPAGSKAVGSPCKVVGKVSVR